MSLDLDTDRHTICSATAKPRLPSVPSTAKPYYSQPAHYVRGLIVRALLADPWPKTTVPGGVAPGLETN